MKFHGTCLVKKTDSYRSHLSSWTSLTICLKIVLIPRGSKFIQMKFHGTCLVKKTMWWTLITDDDETMMMQSSQNCFNPKRGKFVQMKFHGTCAVNPLWPGSITVGCWLFLDRKKERETNLWACLFKQEVLQQALTNFYIGNHPCLPVVVPRCIYMAILFCLNLGRGCNRGKRNAW